MRICAFCNVACDSQIGFYDELKKVFWGGARNGNVQYDEKRVYFFCSEEHRNDFLAPIDQEFVGFHEIQTDRWQQTGED